MAAKRRLEVCLPTSRKFVSPSANEPHRAQLSVRPSGDSAGGDSHTPEQSRAGPPRPRPRPKQRGPPLQTDEESGMDAATPIRMPRLRSMAYPLAETSPSPASRTASSAKRKAADAEPDPSGSENGEKRRKRVPATSQSEDVDMGKPDERDDQGEDLDDGEQENDQESQVPIVTATQRATLVTAGWADHIARLRSTDAVASPADVALAEEIEAARIGSAYIRFISPADVRSVINIDNNPNARANPRGLTDTHVDLLAQIFRRANGKKDHESPIYIMVDEDKIDPDLRNKMDEADAYDATSAVPLLQLLNDTAMRKAELENELWIGRVENRWLTAEEINARSIELAGLRAAPSHSYCTLLNGHHRIRAMLQISQEIQTAWAGLRTMLKEGRGDEEDVEEMAKEIWRRVEENTWRVVVYNSKKLTEAGKSALVRNEHERPAKGMSNGEKAWWLAQKFDAEIKQEIERGGGKVDRVAALNIIQARWRADIGSKMLMTGQDDEADTVKTKSDALKDVSGDEPASRLFFNPLSMEMVMDIRPALSVFDHVLERQWAIEMLRPSGGPLIAHYWLDARVLMSIFDVDKGERLTDAEVWLDNGNTMLPGGHPTAAELFEAMHTRAEKFPPYLEFYKDEYPKKFGDLFLKAIEPFKRAGDTWIDESKPEAVSAIRGVFDQWGRWLQQQAKNDYGWKRFVGTSARLFARLPLYRKGVRGPAFYPNSALPCHAVFKMYLERWAGGWSVPGNGDCLVLLEQLLDRGQFVWTIGAQGFSSAVNWNEWYSRARGLHQIVMRLVQCREIGPLEARLTEALAILEDPRLPISLHAVNELFPDGRSLRDEMRRFSAMKTGGFQYLGARDLLEQYESEYGSFEDLHSKMLKARSALKIALWPDGGKRPRKATDPQTLDDCLGQHEILGLVHHEVWAKLYPEWFRGWRDSEAKRMNTIGGGIGFGILDRWLVDTKFPEILQDDRARWTVHIVKRICLLTNTTSWWSDLPSYKCRKALPMPKDLPDFLKFKNRAAARKAQKAAEKEKVTAAATSSSGPAKATRAGAKKSTQGDRAGTHSKSKPAAKPRGSKAKSKATIEDDPESEDGDMGRSAGSPKESPNGSVGSQSDDERGEVDDRQQEDQGNRDAEGVMEATMGVSGPREGVEDDPAQSVEDVADPEFLSDKARGKRREVDAPPQKPTDLDISEYGVDFHERTPLPHTTEINPPRGEFRFYHRAVERPNYVMAPPIASVRMPHHAWRQLIEPRALFENLGDEEYDELEREVREAMSFEANSMGDLLEQIGVERNNLRETALKTFSVLCSSPMASDVAMMQLPDVMAGLRDMFIARVAKLFVANFSCSYAEAIHEASAMAYYDGMYTEDFTTVDEDGVARLDLTFTFPKALQSRVSKRAVVTMRNVGDTQRERDKTVQLMRYVLPCRGLGRTENESKERGILAVEHRETQIKLETQSRSIVHGLAIDPEIPVDEPVGNYRESANYLLDLPRAAKQWASVQPAVIRTPIDLAPYSNGDFLPRISSHKRLHLGLADQWVDLCNSQRLAYQQVWNEALEREYEDWDAIRELHDRNQNSQGTRSSQVVSSVRQAPPVGTGSEPGSEGPPNTPIAPVTPVRHSTSRSRPQQAQQGELSSSTQVAGNPNPVAPEPAAPTQSQSFAASPNDVRRSEVSPSLGGTQQPVTGPWSSSAPQDSIQANESIRPGDSVSQMALQRLLNGVHETGATGPGRVLVPSSSQLQPGQVGATAFSPYATRPDDDVDEVIDGSDHEGRRVAQCKGVYRSLFSPTGR
ncbi:hypothetical protein FRC06_000687 [Ceratobasidium sp. 370]|nr:hypothetical protein FRC06_000687 [Ceratobasidium sp. 370]